MDDLISRQAAIDILTMALDDDWETDYATDRMNEIPSAVDAVEVRYGKWQIEFGKSFVSCSECGFCIVRIAEFNYCPNCGAKMKGRA